MYEQARLDALHDYQILDTPPEMDFDRLTRLAAAICQTPIATITLVDKKRQWFKSTFGITLRETDRAIAFCAHAIESRELLLVEDAQQDPRFTQNPLVTGSPHLRFYAGVPLISPSGFALGTLAVMDLESRRLNEAQMEGLATLAQQVMVNLELRRQQHAFERLTSERVRIIFSAAAIGIAVTNIDGQYLSANPAYCRMLRCSEGELQGKIFTEILAQDELPEALAQVQKLLSGELADFTYEARWVRYDGELIWVRSSVSLLYAEDGKFCGMVAVADDITQRKITEAKARQLAERLVTTLESITDAFYTLDHEWNFTYVNREAERFLLRSHEQLLGQNLWQEFPASIGSPFESFFRQAIEENHPVSFEEYYPPLQTWFRVNAYPSAEGLAIYFQNVNEQRAAQQQLRLLETCVARMNDIVLITEAEPIDEPGPRILFVNNAFVSRTGYSRAEVMGKSPRFLQGPKTQRAELDRVKVAMKSWQPVRAELINYTKSGEEFWLEMDLVPIANNQGQFTHWVGVERDITERKKSEQAIRESEERFKLVSKATADAIWDWDLINDHMWWSEGIQTLFGVMPNEVEVDSGFWASRIHPDDQQRVLETINQMINGTQKNWLEEYRFCCSDGSYAYVQDRGFVIRTVEGKAIRLVGGMTDLTLAKQTALELERLGELERAQQIAELASQTKSTFLATMSHEIRTPINGVIGMVDVLQQTSLKGYQVEMVDIIRDSAYSLLGIIDDILDFSKIEAGKLDIEAAPLSLPALVKSVCVMLDRLAENKAVELTLFVDPALPEQVLGDSLRLRQVLVNLVNNAIKFSGGAQRAGRVSVRIQVIDANVDSVLVEFQVIDNGIGMSSEVLQRLFKPFVQGDASTTRNFGGTGLGLTITRHLVELMKGEIHVQSESDEGSQFTVRIPFICLSQPEKPHMAGAGVAGLACTVIGDNESLANDLAWYLSADGAQVMRLRDLDQLRMPMNEPLIPPSSGMWIWIIDSLNQNLSFNHLRAAIPSQWQHIDIRWLIIGRGQRRKPRREQYDMVSVDGNLLDRRTFLRAVAIAAGRAEEEITPPSTGKHESAFLPPARALAMQQKRLVLVAEDNPTNQKVILRQLALLGYAADIVSNGREALLRWSSGDYALLLTDLHMPEMDGYALAAAIRAKENGYGYIPIIALSANALRGEAERCRELGMDEYLCKPTSLAELQSVLERWLPHVEFTATPKNVPAQQQQDLALDIRVLEELVGHEAGVVREFLQDFRLSAQQMANELKRAGTAQERARVAAIAHKLKSSARSVGALKLGDLCARLEIVCNEEAAVSLAEPLVLFFNEMTAVNKCLDTLLDK